MRRMIRSGRRPALFVYSARLHPISGYDLVCSDDVAVLLAYREERFGKVPVALLHPRRADLEESALLFRHIPTAPEAPAVFIQAMRPRSDVVPSLLGDTGHELASTEALKTIYRELLKKLFVLRRFNYKTPQATRVHYHESLASALVRAARLVTGIHTMYRHSLFESAAALIRALYELSLSIYLDWLCPETIGPYFQQASRASSRTRKDVFSYIARKKKRLEGRRH